MFDFRSLHVICLPVFVFPICAAVEGQSGHAPSLKKTSETCRKSIQIMKLVTKNKFCHFCYDSFIQSYFKLDDSNLFNSQREAEELIKVNFLAYPRAPL